MPRRLGQHFLRPASVERLLRVVDPRPDQHFLEIGAGSGALTLPLAARSGRVTAIELDAGLVGRLQAKAPANLTIVRADALEAQVKQEVGEAFAFAAGSPFPKPEDGLRNVFTSGSVPARQLA